MGRAGLLFVLVLARSAWAATLWVALPGQAAPCDLAPIASALRSRVGGADVRPGSPAAAGSDVAIVVERRGDRWLLRVRAPGERELRRDLPPPGADCVALRETVASMVERYLEEIRWTGASALVAPLPAPAPPPAAAPWQMVLEAGAAAQLSTLGPLPAGELEAGARRGRFQLAVSGVIAGGAAQPVGGDASAASIRLQLAVLQLSAGWRFPIGLGALLLSAVPGSELLWARAEGALVFGGTPRFLAVPFLGGSLAWEVPLAGRFGLTLHAEARGLFSRQIFTLEDDPTGTRVQTPAADGEAGLALSYLFF